MDKFFDKSTINDLMRAVKKHDTLSAEKLYDLIYNPVRNYVLTKVDNKEDVDAILSDIFKMISEKAKHTMYYTNSVGHIYKIAKRKVFDYYKTKGLEFKTTDNDASEFELDVVMNLVLASCTKTQVNIIKSRGKGMSDKEIAEELEMSVELVKDEINVIKNMINRCLKS